MNDYARQAWKDCNGQIHDTEEEAVRASRAHEVGERMRARFVKGAGGGSLRKFKNEGLRWFLEDPATIVETYLDICAEVNRQMAESKD